MAAAELLRRDPAPDRGRGGDRPRRRPLPLHRLPQDHRRGLRRVRGQPALTRARRRAGRRRRASRGWTARPRSRATSSAPTSGRPKARWWSRRVRSPHPHAAFAFGDLAGCAAPRPAWPRVFTAADIPGRNAFGVDPALRRPARASPPRPPGSAANAWRSSRSRPTAPTTSLTAFPITWTPLPPLLDARRGGGGAGRGAAPRRPPGQPADRGPGADGRCRRGAGRHRRMSSKAAFDHRLRRTRLYRARGRAPPGWRATRSSSAPAPRRPCMDRDDTAAILGLPPERVRIIPSAVGGGFGSKLDISLQPLIGLVALKTGRPGADGLLARSESMASTTKRHPARDDGPASAATPRGGSPASSSRAVFDTGAYASWGPTVANRVPVHVSGPYRDAARHRPAPGRSTPTARSPAPSAALACRRRRSGRRRSTTGWPTRPGSTGWSSASRTRCATATPRATGQVLQARRHRRLPRGAAAALGARALAEANAHGGRTARRRRRLLLVRLRQHRAAEPLDHPHRPRARRARWSCTRARPTSARARTP